MLKFLDNAKKFIFDHKTEIAIGIGVGLCVTGYLFLSENKSCINSINIDESSLERMSKSENSILTYLKSGTEEVVEKQNRQFSCGEFEVSSHIRNLPSGQTHSATNEALAHLYGIDDLSPNQSFINTYSKNIDSFVL